MNLQVLHLTGQSDPRSCALSPVQDAFLDALPLAESAKVRLNFPYDDRLAPPLGPAWRPVPLWLGSLRHLVLFWRIRLLRGRWARRHRPLVEARLRTADRTLVLAGSIGLDLLGRLSLPTEVLDRLTVVAYGAVATRPPACRTVRVGSRGDHLARWWPHEVSVDAGHLDYLAAPELAALCRDLATELS
ncbi:MULTISPECIES: hypothetical protein [unclassified Nocardioides]|uniref:hypothetical protein n=1 Tax=unclassified Nocardioides TaxID=2615069 RepID=UPI001151197D|nr:MULTISPECIES: hypothetical protein [unclassified Nocardioides]TQK72966.1 hypothetical protein FBY23_4787 [Nocardioides sp. SLBN-35]WGY02794.1 hypothetical protein QI633_03325 [Nocardioides sp. QY071]